MVRPKQPLLTKLHLRIYCWSQIIHLLGWLNAQYNEKNTVHYLCLLSVHSNTSGVFSESSKYFLHWKKYYYNNFDSQIEAVCFLFGLISEKWRKKKGQETVTELDSKSQWAKLQKMSTLVLLLLKSITSDISRLAILSWLHHFNSLWLISLFVKLRGIMFTPYT